MILRYRKLYSIDFRALIGHKGVAKSVNII